MIKIEGFSISPQQKRLWELEQNEGTYRSAMVIELRGPVQEELLEEALHIQVVRHQMLRTLFHIPKGMNTPLQVVSPTDEFSLKRLYWGREAQNAKEFSLLRAMEGEVTIDELPIAKAHMGQIHLQENLLVISLPAFCCDSQSLLLLYRDIFQTYRDLCRGAEIAEEEPVQYAHFSQWLEELAAEDEDGRAFWSKVHRDLVHPDWLPVERLEKFEPGFRGFYLEGDALQSLLTLQASTGAGLDVLLLAAWCVLLNRFTQSDRLSVAAAFDGRSFEELGTVIGPLQRYLPFNLNLLPAMPFEDLLRDLEEKLAECGDWQDFYGLHHQSTGPSPRYGFEWEVWPEPQRIGELEIDLLEKAHWPEHFALRLYAARRGEKIWLELNYDKGRFSQKSITTILRRLRILTEGLDGNGKRPVGSIGVLTPEERTYLLHEMNRNEAATPLNKPVHHCFEDRAAALPDRIALVFEGSEGENEGHPLRRIGYAELNQRANHLGLQLIARGIGPGDRVVLCCHRTLEFFAGLLGVLKAGAAYLPLDPYSPESRLNILLEESRPALVLTGRRVNLPPMGFPQSRLEEAASCPPCQNPQRSIATDLPAYVLFTSGSTGRPKAVLVSHANLSHYTGNIGKALPLEDCYSYASASSLLADLGNTAIFPPLCRGGELHLISQARAGQAEAFAEYFHNNRIDCLKITPSHLKALLNAIHPERVLPAKLLVLGGEPTYWSLVDQLTALAPKLRIFNHYGPTETTIGAITNGRLDLHQGESFPLGKPIPGVLIYVLNRQLEPVNLGLTGEIYIGGDGLSSGYLHKPAATALSMIPHPFADRGGQRLYRTGDQARWLSSGAIEFLGRDDQQIKIRGFRVELGEILAALLAHPLIGQVWVEPHLAGTENQTLVVYWSCSEPTSDTNLDAKTEFRSFLLGKLPDYMIPNHFMRLEHFPLTPNGKIDRKALPEPEISRSSGRTAYVAPRTATERVLAKIWSTLLNHPHIGIEDHFFDLGGHSISGTILMSHIKEAFEVDLFLPAIFEAPTIRALARRIHHHQLEGATEAQIAQTLADLGLDPRTAGDLQHLSASDLEVLALNLKTTRLSAFTIPNQPREQKFSFPLSFAQQRLWFLDQLEITDSAYNTSMILKLQGELHPRAMEAAFSEIIGRHEVLRTSFATVDGRPVQIFHPHRPLNLPFIDLSALDENPRTAIKEALQEHEPNHRFDLVRGPLVRLHLARLEINSYLLFVTLHHLVSDAWSKGVMVDELEALYAAFAADRPSPLAPLSIQYADFAHWQRLWLQGTQLERQRNYWRFQLKGVPTVLELPTDQVRPAIQSFRGSATHFRIEEPRAEVLRQLARRSGVTLFMFLDAAFALLLHRYSHEDDLCIGTPVANRNRKQVEPLIGFFLNTLVMRHDLSGTPDFRQFLVRVRKMALDAYAHQDLPFERVVDLVKPERNVSHTPLFQVLFILQHASSKRLELPGLTMEPLEVQRHHAKFDLTMALGDTGRHLAGTIEYSTDLFEAQTMARFAGHFQNLLQTLCLDQEIALEKLEILGENERQNLLRMWNQTTVDYPEALPISRWFESRAQAVPERTALVWNDHQLSYAELNRRANRVAAHLKGLRIGPEDLVGLCIRRSPELVIGLLGTLKAGAAYVPMDPTYPEERLATMIEDSQAALILTQTEFTEKFAPFEKKTATLDGDWPQMATLSAENPDRTADPDAPLYVIYTSGSTGRPKGVVVHHRPLVNLSRWMEDRFGTATVLQFTTLNFDPSYQEIFTTLVGGGKVQLIDQEVSQDPMRLLAVISEALVERLFMPFVALQQMAEVVEEMFEQDAAIKHLRQVFHAGEQLKITPNIVALFEHLPNCRLFNHYGPSETHVCTAYESESRLGVDTWPALPPIGKPIANTQIYLLDRHLQAVPTGVSGELFIGGEALGRGYHNLPQLTAWRFIPDHLGGRSGARLYRSGDLSAYRADGHIIFRGRIDHQVKLRGFRIEPGEIETALGLHPDVAKTVAVVREDFPGEKRLVAYMELNRGSLIAGGETGSNLDREEIKTEELRRFLAQKLPEYMIPSIFVFLETIPLNANGKVDRKTLPKPQTAYTRMSESFVLPHTKTQQTIATIWGEVLHREKVGIHHSFFELGGDSISLVRVHRRLLKSFPKLDLVSLFRYPTIEDLARHLSPKQETGLAADSLPTAPIGSRRAAPPKTLSGNPHIAVVGMAGRFPGAGNLDQFWANLRDGVESISFFSDEELAEVGIHPSFLNNPLFVKAGAVLDQVDLFDARFFGYSDKEAEITDPQQRVFLECAWEAVEHAGYDALSYPGLIGVFAGVGMNTYAIHNLYRNPAQLAEVDEFRLLLANDKDFLPTRVSYKLNLKGPSVNVQTSCSTSLVAVHMACRSLIQGECHMAMAGGVSIRVPLKGGYFHREGMISSPDGHCRTFDAKAKGTVSGSGVGIVMLKPLEKAMADGDQIYGVIRGSAINNDGAHKVSFTAPSVAGQAACISEALNAAGVNADDISYVEAHGTATTLGDPIEIEALTLAYGEHTDRRNYCPIASLKSNMGHLNAAAGVGGLLKTLLSLQHGRIPPSLHFEKPNPKINFAASPFFVNDKLRDWENEPGRSRLAGVSSFGVGGTNAHVIVGEAPPPSPGDRGHSHQLLLLSAKTATALENTARRLADHLETHTEIDLADVAFTLKSGRATFPHRRALVARNRLEALAVLRDGRARDSCYQTKERRPVFFLFPGQGSQFPQMGRALYDEIPCFRREFDACATLLKEQQGLDIKDQLYPETAAEACSGQVLKQTLLAQTCLFSLEYALAKLLMTWGIQPQAMIGHSLGEYVVACLAGVFSLPDALKLVAVRAQAMQQQPPGAMLAMPFPEREVRPMLEQELALAAVNGPNRCVVSGPEEKIEALRLRLAEQGVTCKLLHTSHAFHSGLMAPAAPILRETLAGMELKAPQIPYLTNLNGTWATADQVTQADYWCEHLQQTVRFADGLELLLEETDAVFVEVGPGGALTALAKQVEGDEHDHLMLPLMRSHASNKNDLAVLLKRIGQLWLAGNAIDWPGFYADEKRRRLPLPSYPFERKRYWIEPMAPVAIPEPQPEDAPPARQGSAPENGKHDEELVENSPSQRVYVPANDDIESGLVTIWQELLGGKKIGITDNFFDLGGDSMLATQVNSRIRSQWPVELAMEHLFEETTIAGLAALIRTAIGLKTAPVHPTTVELEEGEL